MQLNIRKITQSGFEMWGVSVGAKLVGSYWTENAARARRAELLGRRESASKCDAPDLLASILGDMRAHWNAPFAAKSPDYETWRPSRLLRSCWMVTRIGRGKRS